ncbi:regulator of Ty1 Transposition [Lithohypha guttulata]|uniref:Regulator of Ty1 Transposition n=1 Tax=Lithohypha guttulata TaxID=1690604 RepID=A0AAN7YFP0_9EURO|nr:regulator of Ty1 Transposition [Lithohypha guttulata]
MAGEPDTRQEGTFSTCSFAIVRSDVLNDAMIKELCDQIDLHGGTCHLDNYPDDRLDLDNVTHIISATTDFPDYYSALDRFIHVVKPTWVTVSIATGKLAHPRKYSPDPNLFMNDVVATCVELPQGDADAIAGGILAMGGNYSFKLTSQITHVVALNMENDVCESIQEKNLNIKMVLPHWFDDCLRLGKKIDEGPYLLPDPEILNPPLNQAPSCSPSRKHLSGATSASPSSTKAPSLNGRKGLRVFKKKRILLEKDLQISDVLRGVLNGMILASDGTVVDKASEADILVCKYRDGQNYNYATAKQKDVGNLAWLYYLIIHDLWTSPLRRLLHYPLPKKPLEGFAGLKIGLSNYSGEARTYLENLISATGAICTKTLKQDNDFLITAHRKSEKVNAAEEWGITVVNHLWVEESFAKWQKQSITKSRYTHFPTKTNLGEVVGQTEIDRKVIEAKFLNLDAIPSETLPGRRRIQASTKVNSSVPPSESSERGNVTQTPVRLHSQANGKENGTPATEGSRKSKTAAAVKLQEMTPDIALFEKERKRVGGVVYGGRRKDDPERVEPGRKRSAEPAEPAITTKKTPKRQRTGPTPVEIRLLISGYKPWVGNAKKEVNDTKKLRELGISIVDVPAKATHFAVPGIVRTPKFMVAVAYAPMILTTDFIEACLSADELVDPSDYELVDKQKEKEYKVKLKDALQKARENDHKLLEGYSLYCTEKVSGGYETFKTIAEANGASLAPYRGRQMTISSRRVGEDDAETANEVVLLSSDTAEDKTLWPKFQRVAADSRREPFVLLGEWLLTTALRQEIQPFESYELTKLKAK